MPISEEKFNEITNHINSLVEGLAEQNFCNFSRHTSSQMDYILGLESTSIGDAIFQALAPAAVQRRERYYSVVEFKVRNLPDDHPLTTSEGRIHAHQQIFEHLVGSVKNETGRLGKCLREAEETTGKRVDEIRTLIDDHISHLRDTFTSDAPYPEKNKQILALRAFYNEIRDPTTLVNFIRSNESSLGLR